MEENRSSASDQGVMVPTPRTVWMRHFLPWQLLRFVVINLRMLKMIGLSHAHHLPPKK